MKNSRVFAAGRGALVAGLLMISGSAIALAQEETTQETLTVEGAKVMLTEIPGATDCQSPQSPGAVPDGASSSEQEMLDYIAKFKEFDAAVADYQGCLDKVALENQGALTEAQQMALLKVGNAYADEAISLGEDVNAQVRAFNEAEKAAGGN